jgi:hypothetical protein
VRLQRQRQNKLYKIFVETCGTRGHHIDHTWLPSISQALEQSTAACLSPCRRPRTTNDPRGNGSSKQNNSFAQYSHLEVPIETWMCRVHYPQAPMFRRLALRLSRLRPEDTLHRTLHTLFQILQYQVSRLAAFIILGFEHNSKDTLLYLTWRPL